jgi:multidrug efflux pump subunit AcrA (membrane-fusion protein)
LRQWFNARKSQRIINKKVDIQRTGSPRRRYRRFALMAAVALGAVLLAGVAFSLAGRPAGVDKDLVWSGDVKRGEFIHEVTAAGTLFAPEIRSITSRSDGIVERVHVLPGHVVAPGDVLVELSSTNLNDDLQKARTSLDAAEAEDLLQRAKAEDDYLNQQVTLASIEADYASAQFESSARQKLAEVRATSELELRNAIAKTETQKRRFEAAKAQLERYPKTRAAQEASAAAKLTQQRRDYARLEQQVADLKIRAGLAGTVQSIDVEEGARVTSGKEVARIVNPANLIARVRVSERDAALVQVGQAARLELGRENLEGHVTRVEPAVKDRLVTVDIALESAGRTGLRPDLSVTARIEIDRAAETLVLDRPAALRDDQKEVNLFRLDGAGTRARRVKVEVRRISARQVEIASGLAAGDRVILADMTEWLDEPEIRIR